MAGAQHAFEPRLSQPHAGERARSRQLRFEQRHLRHQHVGARGHAGTESIGHHASRFGGASDRVGGGATIAWLESRSSSRWRTSADTIESNSAIRSRVARRRRRRFGRLRLRAAGIEEVPVDRYADVPRLLPLALVCGKMRGFGLA